MLQNIEAVRSLDKPSEIDANDPRVIRLRQRAKKVRHDSIKSSVKQQKHKDNQFNYEDYYSAANVTQHSEFEQYLKDTILNPKERETFYKRLLEFNHHLEIDTFKPYFELYAAERKSFQQDYTPDPVAKLLATLTRSSPKNHEDSRYAGYDMTAGTGSLLIQKWNDDRMQESPWSYAPHRYFYRADEIADNVIPYLIHNLALRGMNAIVVHGNALTGETKQIYFIQNSNDDYLAFSDVNVLPHTVDTTKYFGVTKWLQEEIKHIESQEVIWQFSLPMKRMALKIKDIDPSTLKRPARLKTTKVKDVALTERAKKGRIYARGSIIVQISATKGQVGLLKSSGEVGSQYVVIRPTWLVDSSYLFYSIQHSIKKHFHRVQEGLNVPFEEVGNIPISLPDEWEKQATVRIFEQLTLF